MKISLNTCLLLSLITTGIFFTGCAENPADDVEKAKVEDADKTASAPAAPEPAVEKTVFVFSDSSKIEFTGSKVTGSHDGGFSNFVGKFEVAGDALAPRGRHSVIIDMNSIYTDNEKLTEHLKSEDFFHVDDFPMARFDLDEAVAKGDDQYELSGTLDLHGVAKKITFPATVKVGEATNLVDFNAEFAINRKDFNIVYPGKPDDLIRDEVVMKLTVSAVPGEPEDLQIGINGAPPAPEVTEERRPGGPGDGRGKGGGKGGRPDWRNMSEEERAKARQEFLSRIDTNNDGNIGKDEVDERMWGFIGQADKDGDNQVTEAEREAFRAEREAERALRELNGEDPGPRFGGKGRGPGGGDRGGDRDGDRPQRPAVEE